ncbi:unnamed protein product [Taenia asiatica]|uniref:Uncharacterized protein n=1 Tax=Taenia asiatica TaxID=60517 RepID=A0A3P6NTA4_TAEAS|nr:unnamed protein product [Taenia asiatica]
MWASPPTTAYLAVQLFFFLVEDSSTWRSTVTGKNVRLPSWTACSFSTVYLCLPVSSSCLLVPIFTFVLLENRLHRCPTKTDMNVCM